MTEIEYIQFHDILAVMEILVYAACMAAFFHPFPEGETGTVKGKGRKLLVILSVYVLVYLIGLNTPVSGRFLMVVVIGVLLCVPGFLGMDRALIFFLGEIFFSIRNLCMMAMISVGYLSDRYVTQDLDTPEKIFLGAAVNAAVVDVFEVILLSVMLYTAGRLIRRRKMELQGKALCCMLVVPVTGILFVYMIIRLLVVVKEDVSFILFEQFPAFLWAVPMAAALFYGGILLTIVVYQKIMALQEEKEKYFVQEQQIRAVRERVEEVEQLYESVRRMRHEMRNHLTNVKGLVQSGSYGEMEQYIARMDESMEILEFAVKTGNAVTDVILSGKRKAAEKLGIHFCAEFSFPESEGYDAYDVGIILNNLLTNAIEACGKMPEGERYISLSGRRKKKFFLIEVRNSFMGEILFDKRTNLPVSTKEKDTGGKIPFLHGIGLWNVKCEVEKYMGDMDICIEGNEFCIMVMLQERNLEDGKR